MLVLTLISISSFSAKAEDSFKAAAAMQSVAENYVRPSYASLVQSTGNLKISIEALCALPSVAASDLAEQNFTAVAINWARIEFFRSGPIMAQNRVERMLFFPDRKGTGLKQVQALIADEAAPAPSAGTLAERSVAVQGLGALEYVLFGAGADQLAAGAPRRCAIGASIAENMFAMANELEIAWAKGSETDQQWAIPNEANPFARSDLEATNLLLGTIIHGLEAVRDLRLRAIFGKDGVADKPKSALFWRSGLTLKMVVANLEGARDLFEAASLSDALPQAQANLANTVRFAFRQSIKTAQELAGPIETTLSDPIAREKLAYLALSVDQLIGHLDQEFAPAAGLAAGFSFGDGD